VRAAEQIQLASLRHLFLSGWLRTYRRPTGSYPETGFGEINDAVLETDFWTTSRCLAEIMPFEMRRPLGRSTPLIAVRCGTWGRALLLSR